MLLHPVNLIARQIEHIELPCDPVDDVCAVTGQKTKCIPYKKLFGKSFTNADILAMPGSEMVSIDAYQALKYKWERMSSWIVTDNEFTRLGKSAHGDGWRGKIIDLIITPPDGPWSAYVTTGYKKHGALFAPVNYGKNIWLFETRLVDCGDSARVDEYWVKLNRAIRAGISRTILESLKCPAFALKKIGIKEWQSFESWAKDKYHSSLYSFLCYLLPSQEDLKIENMRMYS